MLLSGKNPKNFEEHVAMFTKIQSKYEEEFEKNRLENLEVVAGKKETKKVAAKAAAAKKAPAKKTVAKPAQAKKTAAKSQTKKTKK